MRVTLSKHGGLAAGIRRPPHVLDSGDLQPHEVDELNRLVMAAKADPARTPKGPGRARDAITYIITVEDQGQRTVLRQTDSALSAAFVSLMQWVESRGKRG